MPGIGTALATPLPDLFKRVVPHPPSPGDSPPFPAARNAAQYKGRLECRAWLSPPCPHVHCASPGWPWCQRRVVRTSRPPYAPGIPDPLQFDRPTNQPIGKFKRTAAGSKRSALSNVSASFGGHSRSRGFFCGGKHRQEKENTRGVRGSARVRCFSVESAVFHRIRCEESAPGQHRRLSG